MAFDPLVTLTERLYCPGVDDRQAHRVLLGRLEAFLRLLDKPGDLPPTARKLLTQLIEDERTRIIDP